MARGYQGEQLVSKKDTSVCDYENETAYSQNMLEKYKLKEKFKIEKKNDNEVAIQGHDNFII